MPQASPDAPASKTGSLLLALSAGVGLALLATVIIAPLAAVGLAQAGIHLPFPRIFDRIVMVSLLGSLLLLAPRLKLRELLERGFSEPEPGIFYAVAGLALAEAAMAVLFGLAGIAGAVIHGSLIAWSVFRYFPAATLIALMEEAFFRAFLLGGIQSELGSLGALLASSAVFAIVHVVRSPVRFYLSNFEPLAGMQTLTAYAERLVHPEVGPTLLGLFLLGLALGEAFLLTRRAYASVGLHAGFVLGAKTWRVAISGELPRWLAGPGPVPLLAAPAAWLLSVVMLMMIFIWLRAMPGSLSNIDPVSCSRRHGRR